MSDREDFGRAADQLSETLCALDAVDLNPLLADDIRTILDCHDDLQAICLRLRGDQHAASGDAAAPAGGDGQ